MQHSGLTLTIAGSRATNTPRQTPNPPKRRPIQQKQAIFSDFHPMGLHFGDHTPSSRVCAAANRGGIAPSKAPTHRRPAARGLRMAQNPHRSQPEVRRIATRPGHSTGWRDRVRPTPPLQWHFREKLRPASAKTPNLGCCERAGRTFSRSHPPSDQAGRTFSRV